MRSQKKIRIGVVGLWHLGCIYSTSLAIKGYEVTGFDLNSNIVSELNKGNPPIYEPGLKESLDKYLNTKIRFVSSPKEAFVDKEYIFVTHDIPVDSHDQSSLFVLEKIFNLIAKYCSKQTIVVLSSQVPVGTSAKFERLLQKREGAIVYLPENLRLGKGYDTFLNPKRLIIGASDFKKSEKFLKDFSFWSCPVKLMSLESAELSKHALNSFLAVNISFISEICNIAEFTNANVNDVINALVSDERVSDNAPFLPGLGFAGGTLGRDLQNLIKISKANNYDPLIIKSTVKINNERKKYLLKRIEKILGTLDGKKIGLLGLTYKPQTSTLRRSLSLEVAKLLKQRKSYISAFDPMVKGQIRNFKFIDVKDSIDEFFKDLDIVLLMTDWPEFSSIDPFKVSKLMKQLNVFDSKNFLNVEKFKKAGFKVFRVGEVSRA